MKVLLHVEFIYPYYPSNAVSDLGFSGLVSLSVVVVVDVVDDFRLHAVVERSIFRFGLDLGLGSYQFSWCGRPYWVNW